MRHTNLSVAFFVTTSLFLFSCKKENAATPGITYKLKTTNTSSSIQRRMLASGTLQWSSGHASVREIEFEAENKDVEIEFKSEVKQKIDLFSSLSSLGIIHVPPGTYEDIEFEVEVQPNGSEAALHLDGQYTNSNGVNTPVVLKVNEGIEIESKKENITIADGSSLSALITLNLSLISTTINESMFNDAKRTNGKIEISATSNTAIYQIMLRNLKACGGVQIED